MGSAEGDEGKQIADLAFAAVDATKEEMMPPSARKRTHAVAINTEEAKLTASIRVAHRSWAAFKTEIEALMDKLNVSGKVSEQTIQWMKGFVTKGNTSDNTPQGRETNSERGAREHDRHAGRNLAADRAHQAEQSGYHPIQGHRTAETAEGGERAVSAMPSNKL